MIARRAWLPLMLAGLAFGFPTLGMRAQDLVADLSDYLIAISTDFTGAEVLLFGSIEGSGDIVVVVRGPPDDVIVRRKERIAGIWVNRTGMRFLGVPSFYDVAASRPLPALANDATLERHGIGLRNLRLVPPDPEDWSPAEIAAFRQALIRDKQLEGTFGVEVGHVTFLGQRLFRTQLDFPANVPTGQYSVSVYLMREGSVVSAQTTPLTVSKIGLSADVYAFSERQAAAYGIIAIVVAVTAGWIASLVFRRP